jgi:hypothetical protein
VLRSETLTAFPPNVFQPCVSAEFGAQFRTDIESLVRREAVEASVVPGRFEQALVLNVVTYLAGFDAAGSSGSDDMTLAVAHPDSCPLVPQPLAFLASYSLAHISDTTSTSCL